LIRTKIYTMLYPEFPAFGFTVAILVLVPLPRQIRAGNIACLALIFWFFEHCLVAAINSVIWAGNVNIVVPVWCDISEGLRVFLFFVLRPLLTRLFLHSEQAERWFGHCTPCGNYVYMQASRVGFIETAHCVWQTPNWSENL
jgi:hypothetical protein